MTDDIKTPMEKEPEFVKITTLNKKMKKKVIQAVKNEKLQTYIKHPDTGQPIAVHPTLVKKLHNGETVTLEDILNCRH